MGLLGKYFGDNYDSVAGVFWIDDFGSCGSIKTCYQHDKTIQVVAAIIHDSEGRIFATQRGYGDFKDYWEFPGGKMEAGETAEEALKREIWEELETRIVVERFVMTVEWDYPQFHLTMHCYLCHVESGHLELKEHEAARWLSKDELDNVEWLPADLQIITLLKDS